MNKWLSFLLCLVSSAVLAQTAPDSYLVEFTDKMNSPFSVDRPQEFLSQRAINRRAKYNIPVTVQDLPVNQSYIEGVKKFAPKILNRSKWFNSINIYSPDTAALDSIRSLPYVRDVKKIRSSNHPGQDSDKLIIQALKASTGISSSLDTSYYNYGSGSRQIGMLNGHILHNQGYRGQGIIIAVLDGGFSGVDRNPAFQSLWDNNQILENWDFVKNTPLSFDEHSHGALVLSIMAANLPGRMVGTAPGASYLLLRTEYAPTEYIIEEDYWISGAEYADSAGADLINSSLGYTRFDDESTNHSYEDLDGNTTRVTRAADIAASKGILVVSSASNEGETSWHYIGAPADADSILSVGAVDSAGIYASFSSTGPTSDGRVKPNIAAQGKGTYFVGTDGNIYSGSGTSFSSPVICGLAACLWQSNPRVSNYDIIESLQQAGSQAASPDSLLGYGLPDFSKAFFMIQGIDMQSITDNTLFRVFPNPFYNTITVDYYDPKPKPFTLEIWDLQGRLVFREEHDPGFNSFKRIRLTGLDNLNPGIFIARITNAEYSRQARILKQRIRQ